jgi:mono/diheme cytochrome c family protein/rhodanese-related sulfurtransferase/predicted lactoylglutathione lyase
VITYFSFTFMPLPKSPNFNFFLIFLILFFSILSCQSDQNSKMDNKTLLGMGYGIDQATILVKDLDTTQKYFTETLGFNTKPSDPTEESTYQSTTSFTIGFAGISRLEFISDIDTGQVEKAPAFITDFNKSLEGVRMYGLSTSSVDSTSLWLQAQGFTPDTIIAGRRKTEIPDGWNPDDGGPQWKRLEFDHQNPPTILPYFTESSMVPYEEIEDKFRYYYSMMRNFPDFMHPNGVVGMVSLGIVVDDLSSTRKEFKKMGFQENKFNKKENTVDFLIYNKQTLEFRAPLSPKDDIAQFLETRGPGVRSLRFEVKNIDSTEAFLSSKLPEGGLEKDTSGMLILPGTYANGIHLEFVQEPEEQAALAKTNYMNPMAKLDSTSAGIAEGMYLKYCALCHGNDREGYAADNAPSLRSHSLMSTTQSSNFLKYVVAYGRANTAMAGYAKAQGGPLDDYDIELILKWLYESSGIEKPEELSREPVKGDVALGKSIYNQKCTSCHGMEGEGVSAPALGNPMLLATASDHFLRYAIAEGRDSTPMIAFKDSLSAAEIDAVTAFIRSRAAGWDVPDVVEVDVPSPEEYILNPENDSPDFSLREGRYVSAEQVLKALQDSQKMVILDARSTPAWRQTHIPGAVPVPYYEEPDSLSQKIPNDSTWIVAYCACPHAASGTVINTLRRLGYEKTAIIDEGILVWAQLGYPVQSGN